MREEQLIRPFYEAHLIYPQLIAARATNWHIDGKCPKIIASYATKSLTAAGECIQISMREI